METEQAEEHLLAVLAAARLGDETIWSEQFTNIAPKNLNLGELECGQTVFDGCQFTNCDFSGTAFYASSFRQCAFSNCRFRNTYWKDCQLADVKLDGCDFRKSRLKNSTLEGVLMRYANFSDGVWEKDSFLNCSFREAFLTNLRIAKVELQNVDLSGADLFQTVLGKIDLSSCNIEGIRVSESVRELKEATIDAAQAVVLAKLLGVHVK